MLKRHPTCLHRTIGAIFFILSVGAGRQFRDRASPLRSGREEHQCEESRQNKRIHFKLVPFYFVRHATFISLQSLGSSRGLELLAVLVEANTRGGSTVAAAFAGANTVGVILVNGRRLSIQKNRWKRTGQSCREWRRTHSTGASGTSWGQSTQRRRKPRRYHL